MSESPTPAPELKTYYGNCHCGAFKFHIDIPELEQVFECNCSVCFRKGYKWVFPGENFTIDKGEDALKDYEFGERTMLHKFCPTCGTGVLGKRHGVAPARTYGINARTLLDVDIWSLKTIPFDGKAKEPQYVPPPYTGPEPTAVVENPKTYTGACHCGAVTLAVKSNGPLSGGGEYIQECDCSICCRNGTTLVYPLVTQVGISNESLLTSYKFGPETQNHKFCPTCGVAVYIERIPVGAGEFSKWHSTPYDLWMAREAVNLRCLEGVEWGRLKVERGLFSRSEPRYVCPE